MKILMPVIQHKDKNVRLDSDIVLGGVELFQKLAYENIEGVIPVYITFEDRMERRTSDIMQRAVNEHKPDIIFTNHFSHAYTVQPRHRLFKYFRFESCSFPLFRW